MDINRDEIAQQLGFRRTDIDMLITVFSKNATSALGDMQAMIEINDLNRVADSAHAIKGSAGNLKLEDIFELSKSIELAASAGENVDYKNLYDQLKVLLDTVKEDA